MSPAQLRAAARVFSIQAGLLNTLAGRIGELAIDHGHELEAPLRQIITESLGMACDVIAQALEAAAAEGEKQERLH